MSKLFLILGILLATGCKQQDIPPTFDMDAINDYARSGGVPDLQGEINRYLTAQEPNCDGSIGNDTPDPRVQRAGRCVEFRPEIYNESNSGAKISAAIKNSRNKKEAFERYFGPLAVYIQSKTGYPASALLTQWADETAWGTSKQVRVNNNIGGHSCFKRKPRYKYPTRQPIPEYIKPEVNVSCTYRRPRSEGGYYMTFANMIDASLSQAYNILHNPGVAKNYAGARVEVGKALREKRKPDPEKVIRGLNGYAAFPPDYKERLIIRMRNEGYKAYDDKTICGS